MLWYRFSSFQLFIEAPFPTRQCTVRRNACATMVTSGFIGYQRAAALFIPPSVNNRRIIRGRGNLARKSTLNDWH